MCVETEQHATMLLEVFLVTVVTVGQEETATLVSGVVARHPAWWGEATT